MRKSFAEVKAWEDTQIHHGTKNWQGLCMSAARSAWGQAPWASSAKLAWERVPIKERHETDLKDIPAGAFCFDPLLSRWGHCWIAAGNGLGYSTDYRRRGKIDICPVNLPAWRKGSRKVKWTTWTPYGHLPIGK